MNMINVYYIHCCRFIRIYILIYFLIADCYSNIRHDVKADHVPSQTSQPSPVPVGLLLDTNSSFASMLHLSIQLALSDFYSNNPNFTTILQLHTRNAASVVEANYAVIDLLENEQVEAMIVPQGSTQDIFISQLGQKAQVPIISTTARSSSLSTTENKYFLRSTMDDSIQARALAAICKGFQWPQLVVLYEDTEYGHHFQSHLANAFRDVRIGLVHLSAIPPSANAKHLFKLLEPLKEQETRVFLVHTNPSLGFRLFSVAKNAGMMREGSAWIITDSLSIFLSSMDSETRNSMEGVIGVRPYVAPSKDLVKFQERWERNSSMDLNVYGLWAYDTVTALAIAAERIGPVTDQMNSSYGPRLLREITSMRFRGLSGYFELVDGRLKASDLEIMNLIGTGERKIGFWNPHEGITVKNVLWPGDSTIKPKGWAIPPSGNLRVGVPWKPGFKQFVDAVIDPATNETRATGFAIDIFLYALKEMPFPVNYTFYIYNESTSTNWSYDSMLHEIPEKYDMVVADTTIWAPRASYVDFSLPYSESGVVLVVKNNRPLNMWIFVKPLSWDLWLAIFVASLIMGFFLWKLEPAAAPAHAPAPDIRRDDDRLKFPFLVHIAALAFPETVLVGRKTSLFLLVCWLLSAFIMMQSYTASFSAILTIDQLRFSFSDDHYIGYHQGSFTREFLTEKLHISPTRLRSYLSVEEYHHAMSRGSNNGGIDAIFDELPYMKILLNRYYSRYRIIGPTFRTDGLGFALPIGSPLVAHFSRAILNVTQGPDMIGLEQKNFGPGYSSQDPLSNTVSQGASSLTFRDFFGLFIILAGFTTFAFLCAQLKLFNNLENFIERLRHRNHPAAVAADDAEGGGQRQRNGTVNGEDRGAAAGRDINGDDDDDADADAAAAAAGGDRNHQVDEDRANEEIEIGDEQNRDGNVHHHLP